MPAGVIAAAFAISLPRARTIFMASVSEMMFAMAAAIFKKCDDSIGL
jgi:hypothetical protein